MAVECDASPAAYLGNYRDDEVMEHDLSLMMETVADSN